jgi:hypothetical protein
MNKGDNFNTDKKLRSVGKIIPNTQLPKKSQVNSKYELTYEHVSDLISRLIESYQRKIEFSKILGTFWL